MKQLVLAHRGFSAAYPENTLPAFQKAMECGADGAELDVQLTRDGVPIVIHDECLLRTTGDPRLVTEVDYAELCTLDASFSFRAQTGFCPIPTLEDYFTLVAGTGFLTNIELKTAYITYPGLCEKVLALTDRYRLRQQIVISSFNHDSVRHFKRLAPDVRCGLLYGCRLIDAPQYAKKAGAEFLHPDIRATDQDALDRCDGTGVQISPWTVNDEKDMRFLLGQKNVYAIITNHPDRLLALRG